MSALALRDKVDVRVIPAEASIRGLFLSSLVKSTENLTGKRLHLQCTPFEERGVEERGVGDFTKWAEKCRALTGCSLRRLGRDVVPQFAKSMMGRTLLGGAPDFSRSLQLVAKAYVASLKPAQATLGERSETHAVFVLTDVWIDLEYQIGIFEGALKHFGKKGEVTATALSRCDFELVLRFNA